MLDEEHGVPASGDGSGAPAVDTAAKRRRFWTPIAVLVVVGAIAVLIAVRFHAGVQHHAHHLPGVPGPAPAGPPLAGPAALAFVRPVAPGKSFEGWTVRAVSALYRGSIRVALDRGNDRVQLRIVKAGSGPPPPARSGPFAVYYSVEHLDEAGDAEPRRLAQALARVVDRNRGLAPPGLAVFRRDSRTPDQL